MKRISTLIGIALVLVSLVGTSCARVFPPAGPPTGPKPTPVAQPALLPHGMDADCLVCHRNDQQFLASLQAHHPVPVPPGFTGSTGEACKLCHTMQEGHTLAMAIPHPLKGMESCFACHAEGMSSIPSPPSNHSNYDAGRCTGCHAPPQTTPSVPGETPAITVTPKTGSPVPHGLAGMENCLGCHGAVLPGVPPMPADHSGRSNQSCGGCHTP